MKLRNLLKSTGIFLSLLIYTVSFAQENCRDFNGKDDKIHIPFQDLNGESELTVEAWVNPDDFTVKSHSIIRQNGTGFPAAYLLAFKENGTDITFGVNTTKDYLEVAAAIKSGDYIGKWHHIAGVFNGSNMTIYVDGDSVASRTHSGSLKMSDLKTHRIAENVNDERFAGKLDEIRLWKVARTESEIESFMDCSLKGPKTGLVAVYNLNDSSSTTVSDNSSNGFDGVLYGTNIVSSVVTKKCGSLAYNSIDLENKISIFPNPAVDKLTITKGDFLQSDFNVSIYNTTGKVVSTTEMKNNAINISDLPNGIYFMQVLFQGERSTHKFIKSD